MAQPIQPLRIQKNTPTSNKTNTTHRPLSELGQSERRRNSPSYNQLSQKTHFQNDSSPFDSSPFANSPRLYWQNRDPGSPTKSNAENRDPRDVSPSPAKRSSIENLKRASRVKNSNMFAREQKHEYDPASSPMIERPLASGRPLSPQRSAFNFGTHTERSSETDSSKSRPTERASMPHQSSSPSKAQASPAKSSISSKSRFAYAAAFNHESEVWSDEEDSIAERQLPPGKSLHRHAKSVTFDAAPPQVNEYEMRTPDPSSIASGSRDGSHDSTEDEYEDESFDRGSSIDREDSFDASLEDTAKTPVVLPEDWRFMSPEAANEDLTAKFEDPFSRRRSPAPTTQASMAVEARQSPTRTDSTDSNGERRPLPPLPPPGASHKRTESITNFVAMAEPLNKASPGSSSPHRPASVSKSDIQSMTGSSMPIEDRLKLMMLDERDKSRDPAEEQRERRLRRGSPVRNPNAIHDSCVKEKGSNMVDDDLDDEDFQALPRISRESILRGVRERAKENSAELEESTMTSSLHLQKAIGGIDPDVPIPSTEVAHDESPRVKRDPDEESEVDVYAIPDLYSQHLQAESFLNAMDKLEQIKKSQDRESRPSEDSRDDETSQYSTDLKAELPVDTEGPRPHDNDGLLTPKAIQSDKGNHRMSLPQFAALLGDSSLDFGIGTFLSGENVTHEDLSRTSAQSLQAPDPATTTGTGTSHAGIRRPVTPEAQRDPPKSLEQSLESLGEPQTPDSVVRHPMTASPPLDSPGIPEPVATIKSSNSRLKTRQSNTPADLQAMAEVRRQISGEAPPVPAIPSEHIQQGQTLSRPSSSDEASKQIRTDGGDTKQPKRKSSLTPLDFNVDREDGLGIDNEFDRLLEAKKKGYLMRQNTKVIVASSASHDSSKDEDLVGSRATRSAGNSPIKPSQTQTWTTEPWNGRIRRKSIRKSGGVPSKPASGPAPPLPGQQSNVTSGLDSVAEDEIVGDADDIGEDGERGRLFVKVVRVKDLDLPLPRGERSYFALTLDNGLHCVTTSWLELGKTAPIGQEFELVVLNDLEFQLTLQTKVEEPKPVHVAESPTKAAKAAKSSAFSRVFASPKKRREMEIKQQEEAQRADRQRQYDANASRRAAHPSAWELLHNLVAQDGSFARAYVSLKDHESSAYGKPFTVDVPCFNEWATEESSNGSSARSKKTGGILRKPPYRVGKLELQMFYVPKPKGAKDEEMPKSMSAGIRELREAQEAGPTKWDGHLSQQGGDCPYWRRRYFSLDGSKFTAYHEATRQPRATINLAKASKLIDDKSALMKTGKGSRRKSAFAEEEEGYMFVEEGFRIRFGNGETIDFYADSAADKESWMKALSEVVGKDMKVKKWTDLVIERHRAVSSRAQQAMDGKIRPSSPSKPAASSPAKSTPPVKSAPPTPAKSFAPRQNPFAVPEKSPRRSDVAIASRRAEAASKTRSMIF